MKRNTSCKFVELLHPPYNAPGWQFFELLSRSFPQTQVNMRTTEPWGAFLLTGKTGFAQDGTVQSFLGKK